MPKTTNTKNTYNQISTNFSASRNYIWPDLKPFLKDIPENSSILDLGCGNGRLLLGLPQKINYLGIDQSDSLIEIAKKIHPKNNFVEGDITSEQTWQDLPLYDYIFCVAVIHHLPNRHDHLFLLEQIKKHLKSNGKILITAWNIWQPKLLKHHLTPQSLAQKIKTKNLKHLQIPFQNTLRFHFAHTLPYLNSLIKESGLYLIVEKSAKNYLVHS